MLAYLLGELEREGTLRVTLETAESNFEDESVLALDVVGITLRDSEGQVNCVPWQAVDHVQVLGPEEEEDD